MTDDTKNADQGESTPRTPRERKPAVKKDSPQKAMVKVTLAEQVAQLAQEQPELAAQPVPAVPAAESAQPAEPAQPSQLAAQLIAKLAAQVPVAQPFLAVRELRPAPMYFTHRIQPHFKQMFAEFVLRMRGEGYALRDQQVVEGMIGALLADQSQEAYDLAKRLVLDGYNQHHRP